MATPALRSLEKAMELLGQMAEDGGARSISALAAEMGLPPSTAYRIAATFEHTGLITRLRRGHYLPGPSLLRLANTGNLNRVLVGVGRPLVEKVAKETGCVAHLGVFEGGMVTYLLKAGRAGANLFTREGTQLDAYCTGIGKVLLATLSEAAREEYLTGGSFIRLTPNTLTEACAIRAALASIEAQGYATDDAEMDLDLACLAVPVRDDVGGALAALSISMRQSGASSHDLLVHLGTLRTAANELAQRLAPR